jgi:hypothetical protein
MDQEVKKKELELKNLRATLDTSPKNHKLFEPKQKETTPKTKITKERKNKEIFEVKDKLLETPKPKTEEKQDMARKHNFTPKLPVESSLEFSPSPFISNV